MQQMLACAQYLKSHGVPFADREIGMGTSRNKLSQMFMLQNRGISIPATLFVRNRKRLLRLVSTKYKESLTWPIIAKATGGTRGDANFLVRSIDELESLLHSSKRHFLIQSYIPNEGDFRALVMFGQLRGLIKRNSTDGSHLNNTSKSGQSIWLPVDTFTSEQQLMAVRAARVFCRDVAGVDVLFDSQTGEPYILEVNRAPQIENASYPHEKADILVRSIKEAVELKTPDKPVVDSGKSDVKTNIIGRREYVKLPAFPGMGQIVAKVDTGALSNSLHVETVKEYKDENGSMTLEFSTTGRIEDTYKTTKYGKKIVLSSNGQSENRYVVELEYELGEKVLLGRTTLSRRSGMTNPILIGRKFLRRHKYLVDVKGEFTL